MDSNASDYVKSLKARYELGDLRETWYCVAACAFAASNQGTYVADVFVEAINGHEDDHEYHRLVLRRIKGQFASNPWHLSILSNKVAEGLLKTGIIYGIPRLINAYRALIKVIPSAESNDISSIRKDIRVPSDTDERGEAYMRNIFRADLDPFLENMDNYWPDLRTLVVTYIYGYYQSDTSILDAVATSLLNVATLVPMDVPAEVGWHMRGTIRNGGSEESLKVVCEITMKICEICEVGLKNEMPKAEDVIHEERLILD